MAGLRSFARDFLSRGGHHVLSSSLGAKVFGFVAQVAIVRMVTPEEYGRYTYVVTLLFVASPFIGGGLGYAMLRFGALASSRAERRALFDYSESRGMRYTLVVIAVVLLLSPLLTWGTPSTLGLLLLGAVSLLPRAQLAVYQSYLRVMDLNGGYAKVTNALGLATLACSVLLTWAFGVWGLTGSLAAIPLVVLLGAHRRRPAGLWSWLRTPTAPANLDARGYVRYGLYLGLGGIASQLTLMSDNIVVANLLPGEVPLALYRTGALIPFTLMALSSLVMVTDFVMLAERSGDVPYLRGYLYNYWKAFASFCAVALAPLYFVAPHLLGFLYGPEYVASAGVLQWVTIGVAGSLLLRVPAGNILSAVGRVRWTSINSYFTLALNLVASVVLTGRYGIEGAAMATCGALWVSGIVNLGLLRYWMGRQTRASLR